MELASAIWPFYTKYPALPSATHSEASPPAVKPLPSKNTRPFHQLSNNL